MDANYTVTLYALIVALSSFALASVAIWSRRELRMRLVALVLALVGAPFIWFAFSQLPGKPDDISAEQFRDNYRCSKVMYAEIHDRKGVLLLVQKEKKKNPEYLSVSWDMLLASSLQKSQRIAKRSGKGWIIYAASSCGEDGKDGKGGKKKSKGTLPDGQGQDQDVPGEFQFYPDPVPPNPEKNYGPLYEGPITLPERQ